MVSFVIASKNLSFWLEFRRNSVKIKQNRPFWIDLGINNRFLTPDSLCRNDRWIFSDSTILDPAVHGRGRRRLRCACWWRTSIMRRYYVSINASCADDQNLKIVRCSTFQGRWYPDFWRVEQNPLNNYFFQEGYMAYPEAQIPSRSFFLPCHRRCPVKS